MEKVKNLVQNIEMFADLQDEELAKIVPLFQERRIKKDETVLNRRDAGDSLYLILDGRVKIVLFGDDGKEIILSTLKEGDFFGEMSLLDGEPRSATVVAIEDSRFVVLKRGDFLGIIRESPDIALRILAEMSRRLRRADEKIGSLALLDVFGRVARVLLELARAEGKKVDNGVLIEKRPTQQELANMIGTSRETVSRVLSDLNKSGYISMHGKSIVVHGDLPSSSDN